MKTKKLTRREFARAIRYGQGRAFLHVKEHGDKGIEDHILHACTNDLVYDMQFENCRAAWLARILDQTGRIEEYVPAILKALVASPEATNSYVQLAALAGELFERGFGQCKQVLFDLPSVVHNRDERLDLCTALVTCAGLSGFRKAIHMMPEADDWVMFALYERTIAKLDDEYGVDSFLDKNKEDDKAIAKFCQAVEREKESRARGPEPYTSNRTALTLSEVLSLVEADGIAGKCTQRFVLGRFGKSASEDDLACILDRLDKDDNTVRLRGYLAIFQQRELPRVSKRIIEFVLSGDTTLRAAASDALSQVKSAKVHRTAMALLDQGSEEDTVIAITLLTRNYRPTDLEPILSALKRMKSEDWLHSVGLDLLTLAEHSSGRGIKDLIVWVCENTPCGGCRRSALSDLINMKATSERCMYEAQWDAHDDARTTARAAYVHN